MDSDVLELEKVRGAEPIDQYEAVLGELIAFLKANHYQFTTPTPASHACVIARRNMRIARDLRDIFGWSLPFAARLLEPALLERLVAAGIVHETQDGFRSTLRISALGRDLLVHSAYPTDGTDAVFFGPDSYRFAALIRQQLTQQPPVRGARLVDIGTGAGAGAIAAAHLCPDAEIAMTDINPAALRLARINAGLAGVSASVHLTCDLSPLDGDFDLVLANPPYIIDSAGRAYRDGGDMHGAAVALSMARGAVPRLACGGRFILYTGSAIVAGKDALHERLIDLAEDQGCALRYAEIDPDVFGEELATEAYRDVERIALVSAVIERPGVNA